MDNGGLHDKFGGLSINEGGKDNNLLKVIKAVEAAEEIIRHQETVSRSRRETSSGEAVRCVRLRSTPFVGGPEGLGTLVGVEEENNRLKHELLKRNQELENLKVDKSVAQRYYSNNTSDEHRQGGDSGHQTTSHHDPLGTVILHQTFVPKAFSPAEGHSGDNWSNGNLITLSGGQTSDNAKLSQIVPPTSLSPRRYPKDNDYEPRVNVPEQGLSPVAENETTNHNSLWKQEAQIRDEKYALEKRIAHLRMAFDQQQQDVVDAASKALSYRQGVIEENVRLTYALQDAQQERTTFVSSLLPLLAEYSLQPQVSDAQSIVSNIKAKLKESQYQLTPWRSYGTSPNFASQSPEHSSGAALTSSKIGLELVPQATYSPANMANSSGQMATDWDSRGQHALQISATGPVQNTELNNPGMFSPLASRDSDVNDRRAPSSHDEVYATHNRLVKFKDPVSSSEVYTADEEGNHNEGEQAGTWVSGNSPYSNTFEDPSTSYSPYLQPVPEEPSSSFSEAADDDPLPAIEDLQISGEPYPGRQLQACGYSVNGTTSCNFEWVRHLEDGSVKYIDGAKQPIYLVTADDVETYLAIEVQPLDDRKRKAIFLVIPIFMVGELVRVFANEHNKIVCDPSMQGHIEQNFYNGHASYNVSLSTNFLDIWEPAILTIKREGYTIKGSATSGIAISEKFSPGTTVTITHGHDLEFSLFNTSGVEHLLRAEDNIADIVSVRDTIVLTLRLFVMKMKDKVDLVSVSGGFVDQVAEIADCLLVKSVSKTSAHLAV
ncbi:hypothetical protein KSS87_004801 [Heliosperma pusillum]|nr:hypothetical protein KSS87_004801 [Heliosperma pusillum]